MVDTCKFCDEEVEYHELVECFTAAIDARDGYTAGHSQRVSDMAVMVAEAMGLPEKEIAKVHIAGHVHDVGKIGIPDSVLKKPGRLTDIEYEIIKTHTIIGDEILSKSHFFDELRPIVRGHHERFDGKGYPDGLAGNDIPVQARILAICDSIDAMSSDRCYRKKHDLDFCYDQIKSNAGTMYDPIIVEHVLKNWEKIICVLEGDGECTHEDHDHKHKHLH